MKVTVDTGLCIGAGNCAMTAPQVFDQDPEEAIVILRDPEPPADHRDAVLLAVQRCPAAVIQVHD